MSRRVLMSLDAPSVEVFLKAPQDVAQFVLDWSPTLATGMAIAAVTWTLDSPLANQGSSFTSSTTTIAISGGVDATTYHVRCNVQLSGGVIAGIYYERAICIRVRDPVVP